MQPYTKVPLQHYYFNYWEVIIYEKCSFFNIVQKIYVVNFVKFLRPFGSI